MFIIHLAGNHLLVEERRMIYAWTPSTVWPGGGDVLLSMSSFWQQGLVGGTLRVTREVSLMKNKGLIELSLAEA